MKKIYLFLVATLFAGAVTAQQRALDLTLTLVEPVGGSTVPQVNNQNLDFEVKSIGDDLIENDTIVLYLFNVTTQVQYSLDQTEGYVNLIPLAGQAAPLIPAINSGQAFTAAMMNGITLDLTKTGFNVGDQIMVAVEIWGANGEEEAQATFTDNIGMFTIGATSSLAINTKDIKVFPNPANDFVNFQVDGLENGNVVISSITGQEVINTPISGLNKVNVSALNNGVYIYKITNANGELVKTSKLVIQK